MESLIPKDNGKKSFFKVRITTDKHELWDTGMVLLYENEPIIDIVETFSQSFKVTIRIVLKSDSSKEHTIKFDVDNENRIITYTCYNFENPMGTGTISPIEIGTINNKKTYIHFWIYRLGDDKNKILKLEYTIWKEK